MKKYFLPFVVVGFLSFNLFAFDNAENSNSECLNHELISEVNSINSLTNFRGNGSIKGEYNDLYYFTPLAHGIYEISINSPKKINIKAGTSCRGKQFFRDASSTNSKIHLIEVNANEQVYLSIWKYNNSNRDDYSLDIKFTPSETMTLTGILRDFHEWHVDFEPHASWENGSYSGEYRFFDGKRDGLEKGSILNSLGADKKPRVNSSSSNNFKPKKLNEWFNDINGVNMSMPYTITLYKNINNLYEFDSDAFFPADGKLFGKEDAHGRSYDHNFHMTYELHTNFTYENGQNFDFRGDDDVWVFINNKLVIDLGGLHTPKSQSVDLDSLGLVEGESYPLDFFWAERHTTGSNFKITTSIELESDTNITQNLALDYHFDECSWDGADKEVKDSSKNALDGKSKNGTITTSESKINRSARFDGSNYISSGDILNDIFGSNNNSFTITAWIKPEELKENHTNHNTKNTFVTKASDSHNDNLELGVNPDGSLHLYLDTKEEDSFADFGSGISVGNWYFIAISYDDGVVKAYIDNQEYINNSTWTGSTEIDQAVGSPFSIGASLHEDNYFNGFIDEVKVFDRALDKSEIKTIFDNENNGTNYDGSERERSSCLSPIGCKEEGIVIDDTKYVYEIDLATGDKSKYVMNKKQIAGASINGFGYNIKDGYLWGSNQSKSGYLVKVGKDKDNLYAQEKIGPINGLPTDRSTYIGDIDDNGHLYLNYSNYPNYGVNTMFVVDLDQNSSDYKKVIDSFSIDTISIADMSFNPVDHQLYAIESDNDFYKIDLNTREVKLVDQDVVDLATGTYGTSFFDSSGIFYAIKNSTRDVVRVLFKDDENGSYVQANIFSSLVNEDAKNLNIDGARCNKLPILIDYGDAVDSSTFGEGDGSSQLNYRTLLSDNGPRHKLDLNGASLYFGNDVDSESDAIIVDNDIDDGLVGTFDLLYTSMKKYQASLMVRNGLDKRATVVGWIDFNRNGRFESKEGAIDHVSPHSTKEVVLKWNIHKDIVEGESYARFRVTTDSLALDEGDSIGIKNNGEVEDYKISIKKGSLYDAWDESSNIIQRVIKTKIVNKDIKVKIASISKDNILSENIFKNVKVAIFSKDDDTNLTNFIDVNFSISNPYLQNFGKITTSHKYAYIKIRYDDDLNITHEVNASDPFSIRPNAYKITTKTIPSSTTYKAGDDFNITIEALDYLDNIVSDYNESFYSLKYSESNAGCTQGNLDFTQSDFKNGKTWFVAKYSEIGKLDLNVSEIDSKEFALIDKYDGSNDNRFINADSTIVSILPSNIGFIWDFKSSGTYSYYSKTPLDVGADLDIDVTIKNSDGALVENFKNGCYSKDVNIKINYLSEGALPTNPIVIDLNSSHQSVNSAMDTLFEINYKLEKEIFSNGNAFKHLRLNFDRDVSVVREPMKLILTDINVSISGGESSGDTHDKSVDFLYIRANAPTQSTVGKELNASIFYEVYCKNCDKNSFGLDNLEESRDSIYWYILDNFDPNFGISANPQSLYHSSCSTNQKDRITINVDKTPHQDKIIYTPFSWLVYNRFNPLATKHSFKVEFSSKGDSWGGKGEVGLTVDHDVSSLGYQKMDW